MREAKVARPGLLLKTGSLPFVLQIMLRSLVSCGGVVRGCWWDSKGRFGILDLLRAWAGSL